MLKCVNFLAYFRFLDPPQNMNYHRNKNVGVKESVPLISVCELSEISDRRRHTSLEIKLLVDGVTMHL